MTRNGKYSRGSLMMSWIKLLIIVWDVKWPNVPAQARRANDVRLSTEARSRRCLQPVCWTSYLVKNSGFQLSAYNFFRSVSAPAASMVSMCVKVQRKSMKSSFVVAFSLK